MNKETLIEKLLNEKAENNNTIDLNAYALGLSAMYEALVLDDIIGSLPTDKIFKLLESDKYGWDRIRENSSTAQVEIYKDIMRATAEVLKDNDI